ncbi:MAG: hypothetical protein GY796_09695, partial [Chloroflexi bacterium]|nr:hypothetical protein [Chloroflexota bacterium]
LAIQGDIAIVGAQKGNGATSNSGIAYIYERNQGGMNQWGELSSLIASDGNSLDGFGVSAAVSNDTAIIGAGQGDSHVNDSGVAYIFERNQGGLNNWGELAKLTASDASALDRFGWSVDIDGDTAIVGARWHDSQGINAGAAYIFERNQGGANNWGQVAKLTASNASAGNWFGISVAISHDTVVVGARGQDTTNFAGAAYIYERNQGGANNWGEITILTASDAAPNDHFGTHVDIDGNVVAIGGV